MDFVPGEFALCLEPDTAGEWCGEPDTLYRVVEVSPTNGSLILRTDYEPLVEYGGCSPHRFRAINLHTLPPGYYWYRLVRSVPSKPLGRVVWCAGLNSAGWNVWLDHRHYPVSGDVHRIICMPPGCGWDWQIPETIEQYRLPIINR